MGLDFIEEGAFYKEKTIAEEKLKQINEERKGLKKQILDERTQRLEEAAKMREKRDEKIEEIQEKLKEISEEIYKYNKLGKVAKMECDILTIIGELISFTIVDKPAPKKDSPN